MLANYNTKETAFALQTAYEERAISAVEKWKNSYKKLEDFRIGYISPLKEPYGNNHFHKLDHLKEVVKDKMIIYKCIILLRVEKEQHLVNEEKIARIEALNAIKKAKLFDKFDSFLSIPHSDKTPQGHFAIKFNYTYELNELKKYANI